MSNVNSILRSLLLIMLAGFLVTCALVCHAAPAATGTADVPDATDLLKRSDAFRNGWPSFVTHVKITNFEAGKPDEEKLYEVSQKGTDKTYVEFMSPREKGRHLLMLTDDMWIYLPDTSRPVRITPLERLSGDASNGDVARTNYAIDYTPSYVRTEKVGDTACYVLDLTAKRKGATYQRILYWIRVEDARPVKAEFYLTSASTSSPQRLTISPTSMGGCCCIGSHCMTKFAITRTVCSSTRDQSRAHCLTSSSTRDVLTGFNQKRCT